MVPVCIDGPGPRNSSVRVVEPWFSGVGGGSLIAEEHCALAEAAFLEEIESEANVARKGGVSAADDNRCHEQLELVHEAVLKGDSGEPRAADGQVTAGLVLKPLNAFRVKASFQPRAAARYRRQCCREDDLVGRLPDPCKVADDRGLIPGRCDRLPGDHHLVHSSAVQVGPDWPFELIEEAVDLLVGLCPVEFSSGVRNVAV